MNDNYEDLFNELKKYPAENVKDRQEILTNKLRSQRWTSDQISKLKDSLNKDSVCFIAEIIGYSELIEKHAKIIQPNNPFRMALKQTSGIYADHPDIEWVCEELQLYPGRPLCLAGAPNSGKSWIAGHILVSIASGKPIFNKYKVKQGKALYISYEMGNLTLELRFKSMLDGIGVIEDQLNNNLHYMAFPASNLTTPNVERDLIDLCDEYSVVAVDSLCAATPGQIEDSVTMGQFVTLMSKISNSTNATFIFLHHLGHRGKKDNSSGALRGSTSIAAASGAIWKLTCDPKHPKQIKMQQVRPHDMARGTHAPFTVITLDDSSKVDSPVRFEIMDEPIVKTKELIVEEAIRTAISELVSQKKSIGHNEIVSTLSYANNKIRAEIKSMVEVGELTETKKGSAKMLSMGEAFKKEKELNNE